MAELLKYIREMGILKFIAVWFNYDIKIFNFKRYNTN